MCTIVLRGVPRGRERGPLLCSGASGPSVYVWGFTIWPHTLWHWSKCGLILLSLYESRTQGLHLTNSAGWRRWGVGLPRLSHKRHCILLISLKSLVPAKARCHGVQSPQAALQSCPRARDCASCQQPWGGGEVTWKPAQWLQPLGNTESESPSQAASGSLTIGN